MQPVIDLFVKGGFAMYPLLLCSILGVAITIERFYSLGRAKSDPKKLMDKIKAALRKKDYRVAVGFCEATPGPVAKALASVIDLHSLPPDEIK